MAYTFDELTVSDLHKDAYGFRPSAGWWAQWKSQDADAKQSDWDYMCKLLEENEEIERKRALATYEMWDNHIIGLMLTHSISRADALRWDMDAQGVDGDVGYYCYKWGLSYSTEDEINEALKG